jgi:hypothetical protein
MSKCADDGCLEFRFDDDAALREGWDLIEDRLFCPLHRPGAARQALQAAELTRFRAWKEKRQAERNAKGARAGLSASGYAAWDQFQSDLADYHREHGKLAPAALRLMEPRKWLAFYARQGRIDVALAAESLEGAEQRANDTRDWLLRRVE